MCYNNAHVGTAVPLFDRAAVFGRTLQDLVREMLRPMLKSWLDDNLSTLVERLVLAEIEQMSGRKPRSAR